MKRIIAILLMLTLLITPVLAGGADEDPVDEAPAAEAVENAEDEAGSVEDEDNINAAASSENVTVKDVALVIAEVVSGVPEFFVDGYDAAHEFLTGYPIVLLEELNSDDEIIFQEAVAMMVYMLGYAPFMGYDELEYPDGYIAKAEEIGLLENLESVDPEEILTKADFIILVRNFLDSEFRGFGPVWDSEIGGYRNVVSFIPVSTNFRDGDTAAYMAEIEARFGIAAKESDDNEEAVAPLIATPTVSTVIVDEEEVAFDAYLVEGNNYFKLRDLAYVLNGSEKQFNVEWDAENNAIILASGEEYEVVGGEMDLRQTREIKFPIQTSSTIYLDGEEVEFEAYLIGGNNYFKLRDVMKAFDVYVSWDEEANTITLDTSRSYVEENADEDEGNANEVDEEEEVDEDGEE